MQPKTLLIGSIAAEFICVTMRLVSCSSIEPQVFHDMDYSTNLEKLENETENVMLGRDKTLSPVIGVLSQVLRNYKKFDEDPQYHIVASYIKWLEASGARARPILLGQNESYYIEAFRMTNGLLFPGGDNLLDPNKKTPMMEAAKQLYKLAVEANDQGDYYPIWGTCLGFELLSVLTSGMNRLSPCSATDIAMNIRIKSRGKLFTNQFPYTDIYSTKFAESIVAALETKNLTYNFHHKCLTRETFIELKLDNFYRDLAYSTDVNGLEFMAAFEAKDYPFYGVQFHPEKEAFEFVQKTKQKNIPHSWESILVSRYFADFFVMLARKNSHQTNTREELPNLIYNYPPSYTALQNDMYQQRYLFPTDGQR